MLVLDLAQRTQSPLDPSLRAKLRWIVAQANRCNYTMDYAAFDFRQEGGELEEFWEIAAGPEKWPNEDRAALQFVRQLTLDAPSTTDEQFASLVARYGEKQVAAMVLLAAYGNFQDRLVMALQLPVEEDGPLPPLPVWFAPDAFTFTPPNQQASKSVLLKDQPVVASLVDDPEWTALSYDALQIRLEQQRSRQTRLRIPSWEEVKAKLPPEYPTARPIAIVWTLVCLGYVPELAVPWNASTRTFWTETLQDRIYEESLFWVQTRAIRCNYCMGHTEMLLELAGLDKSSIAERTCRLASGDWSCFSPAEQTAFAFARKLTSTPWDVTSADLDRLRGELGDASAFHTLWWLCRGLYMTRISDGFQLTLERENVFESVFPKARIVPSTFS
jgi:alkylhydroperoxidase family enzyme